MHRFVMLVGACTLVLAGALTACGKKGTGYDNTRTGSDYYTVRRIPPEATEHAYESESAEQSSNQGRASGGGLGVDGGMSSPGELSPPADSEWKDGGMNSPGDVFKGTSKSKPAEDD